MFRDECAEMIRRGRRIRRINNEAIAAKKTHQDAFTELVASFAKGHKLNLCEVTYLLTSAIQEIAVINQLETQERK